MNTKSLFLLPRVVAPAILLLAGNLLHAQHGVVREYAALAPKADAVPLPALLDIALTEASITRGPDQAYYLTGSNTAKGLPASSLLTIWRSPDLKSWKVLRTLNLEAGQYGSPEIHFLKGKFWLTIARQKGGTELFRFDDTDLSSAGFQRAVITPDGDTPSLFLDDDGTFYWLTDGARIARMKPDPMAGLAGEFNLIPVKIAAPPGQQRDQQIERLRGAHLAKISGHYHLFVTGTLKRNGLGRTGLPQGVDDVLVAASEHPDKGYTDFYVAFPYAGEVTLFRDAQDVLWSTWSGSGQRSILSSKPAIFRVEQVRAEEPRWPIGFAAMESPTRFPFSLMLRPDPGYIYERGMGLARCLPLDSVPGQKAKTAWIRDTFIMLGHDGSYYLTGTSGNMDGINLWRSADLKHFEFVKQVWTPDPNPALWYNDQPKRLFWAPELHYIHNTYWIPFCLSSGSRGKNALLKSTSGRSEGPYELAFGGDRGVDQDIDSSLFRDDDGTAYYVWQDGKIRKLNRAMNGFEGEACKIVPTDGQRVGYEGATLVKIGRWYVLTAAEWNGGGNRSDGTYDMMYSCSTNLFGPYVPRRVAVPHAGHGALFEDKDGRWNASFFGNDRTAPFRAMPGFVPVEISSSDRDLVIEPAK